VNKQHILDDSSKHALEDTDSKQIALLRNELKIVITKVNYHFQSGYERHVVLQTPESMLLNFLKKEIKVIEPHFTFRIHKSDFKLVMDNNFVCLLSFLPYSSKHDYRQLDQKLKMLSEAVHDIDYEELKERSKTLDKFYQIEFKMLDAVKNFSFK